MKHLAFLLLTLILSLTGCAKEPASKETRQAVAPVVVTQRVKTDADDPAIWLHPTDPSRSLILGTDKGGALFVFDLAGRIIPQKVVWGLKYPNNVDVEYGLLLGGLPADIAVVTERFANKIRVYRLPEMIEIDNGGIEAFEGESARNPKGIALYKRPTDGHIFAIVSRDRGPQDGTYLWQYRLEDDGAGRVKGTKVREFGQWSGLKEAEAIAVDDQLGFVYYSDEKFGIRKYLADPDAPGANEELALFGTADFEIDREGIAIYETDQRNGYLIISDQQANEFQIYRREGEPDNPHHHTLVKTIRLQTDQSDGCDVTCKALNEQFPRGLFVAMSNEGTFHLYSWRDIAGSDLETVPEPVAASAGAGLF